jgi:hypothetical protein
MQHFDLAIVKLLKALRGLLDLGEPQKYPTATELMRVNP